MTGTRFQEEHTGDDFFLKCTAEKIFTHYYYYFVKQPHKKTKINSVCRSQFQSGGKVEEKPHLESLRVFFFFFFNIAALQHGHF